jgi:hypothetical protein
MKKEYLIGGVFVIALVVFALLYNPANAVEFKVLDQAGEEVGIVKLDVSLPLTDEDACLLAEEAAEVQGIDFDCDEVMRFNAGPITEPKFEINVIDDTTTEGEFATAKILNIDEDAMTVKLYYSP